MLDGIFIMHPTCQAYAGSPGWRPPFDSSILPAESDHRIANHLSLLMAYVRLKTVDVDHAEAAPNPLAVHAILDSINAQIAAVAKLHRALTSDLLMGSTDLGAHLHEVCAPFAGGLGGAVRIVEDLPPGCAVRPEQVLPVSQIAAELITNALKHACDGAGPGTVLVRCRNDAAGAVRLEIVDTGCGFPAGFDPDTDGGLGFRLVRSLSARLGARIEFESSAGGVSFRLTLPASNPCAALSPRQI